MFAFAELREKHRMDLENLTLTTLPLKTLQLFIFATVQYLRQSLLYIVAKGGWIMVFIVLVAALGLLLVTVDGPHEMVFILLITISFCCRFLLKFFHKHVIDSFLDHVYSQVYIFCKWPFKYLMVDVLFETGNQSLLYCTKSGATGHIVLYWFGTDMQHRGCTNIQDAKLARYWCSNRLVLVWGRYQDGKSC